MMYVGMLWLNNLFMSWKGRRDCGLTYVVARRMVSCWVWILTARKCLKDQEVINSCFKCVLTRIATPSYGVSRVVTVVYPCCFSVGGRPVWLRRTTSGSSVRRASEIKCLLLK